MTPPMNPATPTGIFARRMIEQFLTHLRNMDVSLTRLVELGQAPRENLFAAGTITFGGTVGVTPSTCTIAPPIGLPPGTVLAANPHRRGLSIQNLSASGGPNLTLGLGLTSPQSGNGGSSRRARRGMGGSAAPCGPAA